MLTKDVKQYIEDFIGDVARHELRTFRNLIDIETQSPSEVILKKLRENIIDAFSLFYPQEAIIDLKVSFIEDTKRLEVLYDIVFDVIEEAMTATQIKSLDNITQNNNSPKSSKRMLN